MSHQVGRRVHPVERKLANSQAFVPEMQNHMVQINNVRSKTSIPFKQASEDVWQSGKWNPKVPPEKANKSFSCFQLLSAAFSCFQLSLPRNSKKSQPKGMAKNSSTLRWLRFLRSHHRPKPFVNCRDCAGRYLEGFFPCHFIFHKGFFLQLLHIRFTSALQPFLVFHPLIFLCCVLVAEPRKQRKCNANPKYSKALNGLNMFKHSKKNTVLDVCSFVCLLYRPFLRFCRLKPFFGCVARILASTLDGAPRSVRLQSV